MEMGGGDGYTRMWMWQMKYHWTVHLKMDKMVNFMVSVFLTQILKWIIIGRK
jgi:hypothetical protein